MYSIEKEIQISGFLPLALLCKLWNGCFTDIQKQDSSHRGNELNMVVDMSERQTALLAQRQSMMCWEPVSLIAKQSWVVAVLWVMQFKILHIPGPNQLNQGFMLNPKAKHQQECCLTDVFYFGK